mgnify:CR=1 FL=1
MRALASWFRTAFSLEPSSPLMLRGTSSWVVFLIFLESSGSNCDKWAEDWMYLLSVLLGDLDPLLLSLLLLLLFESLLADLLDEERLWVKFRSALIYLFAGVVFSLSSPELSEESSEPDEIEESDDSKGFFSSSMFWPLFFPS